MVGKLVRDELYLHVGAAGQVPADRRDLINRLLQHAPPEVNVLRLNRSTGEIRFLSYSDFDSDPFPALRTSWRVQADDRFVVVRSYEDSLNPPVLHRKELLVEDSHPLKPTWAEVTKQAEALGLFAAPDSIGFRMNWLKLVQSKGFVLTPGGFAPIGNCDPDDTQSFVQSGAIQRHLTALKRSNLSAPVQLLLRHGLLKPQDVFFDFGCGHGDDVAALRDAAFVASGWDPYHALAEKKSEADVVNLGFVVNVIEDPAERVEALADAFSLARNVLSVAVMLHNNSDGSGERFGDGVRTSRNTFQKYFSQEEFKAYLEDVLHARAHLVAPGVAFVFRDKDMEQRFEAGRYRRRNLVDRLVTALAPRRIRRAAKDGGRRSTRRDAVADRLATVKPQLDAMWKMALDLGRLPQDDECCDFLEQGLLSGSRARRLLSVYYDRTLLHKAGEARRDDLLIYLASLEFAKRPQFKTLEPRLRKDVKHFFGDYSKARSQALSVLRETANSEVLLAAAKVAVAAGLGAMIDERSLQLHIDLVDRLPAILRAYVMCGLVLWGELREVQLVKIHIESGKLTLLEYENFDSDPIPLLRRRVKVNLRRLDYDVFEYSSPKYPSKALLWKSRYVNEEWPGYADQLAFDEELESVTDKDGPLDISAEDLRSLLRSVRKEVSGARLVSSTSIPDLDERCGGRFTFRDLVECGETQQRLGLPNSPRRPETYNALYDLASNILDPVCEYFGPIELSYGFCSSELQKHIASRIAPKLDQHAGCELNSRNQPICARGGAACDFLVRDENMFLVAEWILENLTFDRLYVYEADRPIHVSFGPALSRAAYRMKRTDAGIRVPRPFRGASD